MARKIEYRERKRFKDYVSEFYGKKGIYAREYKGGFSKPEISRAVDKYIQDPKTKWGGGDSIDRELMRDKYLIPARSGKKNLRSDAQILFGIDPNLEKRKKAKKINWKAGKNLKIMKKKKNKRWIQKAKIKKGALHRQLSVPKDKDIPVTLLKRIKNATTGGTISNPTKTGKRRIKITTLIKRRVNFALNVR